VSLFIQNSTLCLFYSAHPNIFVFIDALKNIQKDTYIKLRSTHLNTRRTINIIEKEPFVRNAMKRLEENQVDKFKFIYYYDTSFYQCQHLLIKIKHFNIKKTF